MRLEDCSDDGDDVGGLEEFEGKKLLEGINDESMRLQRFQQMMHSVRTARRARGMKSMTECGVNPTRAHVDVFGVGCYRLRSDETDDDAIATMVTKMTAMGEGKYGDGGRDGRWFAKT